MQMHLYPVKHNSDMKISGTTLMAINFMDGLLFVRMTMANSRCMGKSFITKFQIDLVDYGKLN